MTTKTTIRLSIALLKHVVSTALGDETMQILADEGLGEAQARLDAWLEAEDQEEALSKVMTRADACFGQRVQDVELQQWMHDLPLRDLPALEEALDALPEHLDEDDLEEAIRAAMARGWRNLEETKLDGAVHLYLICLRRALLPLEEQALQVIGRSVLRTEELLRQLQSQIEAWMMREQDRLAGPLPLQPEEEVYLRLLRDDCDRLPLAEDERQSHRDRGERASLDNVYVDLETTTKPTLALIFERLHIPEAEWSGLRQRLETWSTDERGQGGRGKTESEIGGQSHLFLEAIQDDEAWERHPLRQWVQDKEALQPALAPITALEVLQRQRHLVLLGDPGSGKSTFVNHLAFTLAGGMLEENAHWQETLENRFDSPLFPLRVVVRRWSGGLKQSDKAGISLVYQTLETLEGGMTRDMLKVRLHSPDTLVMFDGLDEAPVAEEEGGFDRRRIILDSVHDFCTAHPHCQILVTSRIKPYDNPDYQVPGIPNYTLDELDAPRIQRFVEQWYGELVRIGELDEDEAKLHGDRLLAAMQVRSDLRQMAGTPLLLTMLTIVNRRAGLPESRADLYFEVVDQLLWEWEKRKAEEGETISLLRLLDEPTPSLKTMDVEKVLWELTFEAHERSGKDPADLKASALRHKLAHIYPNKRSDGWSWADRVVALMQERGGLLIAEDDETFRFPHRSFQEYLAARWLLEDEPDELAVALAPNDVWREVILLACGHLAAKGPSALWKIIVSELAAAPLDGPEAWRAPLLAGIAWREYGFDKVRGATARSLRRDLPPVLTDIMQNPDLPPAQRLEAGLIVADLGVLPPDLDALIPVPAAKLDYDFRIGKYLVTNAQFRRFFDDGGYNEDRPWWTEEAVKDIESWSGNEGWRNGPRLWGNARFDRATQPVVGVSWYEAGAYCQWLTEIWRADGVIGQDKMVRLPTEAEWDAAAGEGRYTWGDNFDPSHCNSKESEFDQPSPVHMYPSGVTPSGIHDLCGNVWEWSLDDHESWGEALRGGSAWNDADGVTSAARNWNNPNYWSTLSDFEWSSSPSLVNNTGY